MQPLVSVIVPCRNEAASLARALDSILASRYPPERMEIVIADGLSADGSRAIAQSYAVRDERIRLIDNPSRVTPAALNRAIEVSRGGYILRVDAHSVVGSNYLAEAVAYLESYSGVWSAGGRMRTETEGGDFARAVRVVLSHRFGVGNSAFRTSGEGRGPQEVDALFNGCWRRDVFHRIGGFDERLARSQDIDFSQRIRRAGGRLVLLPHIESVYYTRGAFGSFARQSWTNGVWALLPALHLKRVPLSWRHLAPLAFIAVLTLASLALPMTPWLATAVAGPYLLLNLAASASAAWQARDVRVAVFAPIAFATLHLGYGAGSLWGAIRVLAGLGRNDYADHS